MNESSKKLTAIERRNIVLPILQKELEDLPEYGLFGSNSQSAKELAEWIKDLEAIRPKTDEVKYFLSNDSNKWTYSSLCDYLP